MFCNACGEVLPQGARFCGRCGVGVHQEGEFAPTRHAQSESEDMSRATDRQYFEAHPMVIGKPRPWVRYFARMADIWFWSIVIGLFLGFALPEWVSKTEDIIIGLVFLLLMVPVQASLFAIFGNSVGKSMLGIKVTYKNKSLSFMDAIQREILVYVKGMAFGIPILSFITMLVGYDKLSKNGISSWDKENDFEVTHKDPSTLGIVGVVAIFMVFLFLNVIGSSQGY